MPICTYIWLMSITVLKCLSFVNSRKLPTNLSSTAFLPGTTAPHYSDTFCEHESGLETTFTLLKPTMWFEFLWQIFLLTCHCLKLLCTRILYVKPSTNKHFIFRYVQLKIFFCAAFWRLKLSVEVDKKRIFAKNYSKLRLDTLA